MKVGDYVRTRDGYIAKFIRTENYLEYGEVIETEAYKFDSPIDEYNDEVNCEYAEEIIIKSSSNIMDLIKHDDLIVDNDGNVYQVDYVFDNYVYTKTRQGNIVKTLVDYQIKSIVTKEQFENCMYKVGE